ncbi:MAG: hypothetical protein QOF22_2139 [Bradyrhizobium sp.]|nr:hypothetical protein [Bradyrhizobium sp.]
MKKETAPARVATEAVFHRCIRGRQRPINAPSYVDRFRSRSMVALAANAGSFWVCPDETGPQASS